MDNEPESDNEDIELKLHVWVAGMMYVHQEDVSTIARNRHVECERCGISYSQENSDIQCL